MDEMTYETIIQIAARITWLSLDPVRLAEPQHDDIMQLLDDAKSLMCEVNRLRAEPDNPPLTEEQIRARVGKPVWVKWMKVTKDNYVLCKVVFCVQKGFIDFTDQFCIKIKNLGEYYNLYAHEPKQEARP